jgi:ribosomal protein S12 methylthiotransferase accessory factor
MGCHPSRAIALQRALTEAAQTRLTLIAGSRDDLVADAYTVVAANAGGGAPGARRRFRDVPDHDTDTLDEDVDWELQRLHAAGFDRVIAVELTKEAFALPVVRVIVPGLEGPHDHPSYVPGRRARSLMSARP